MVSSPSSIRSAIAAELVSSSWASSVGLSASTKASTFFATAAAISGGKAIERGSHRQLLANNGVYCKLWDDQSHVHNGGDDADGDDDEQAAPNDASAARAEAWSSMADIVSLGAGTGLSKGSHGGLPKGSHGGLPKGSHGGLPLRGG